MIDQLLACAQTLRTELKDLRFASPVSHVYNPMDYAWAPFETYIRRFGEGQGRNVLLGMNPGPFGMMQVGVPFGEVSAVRDWMGIQAVVERPQSEHPKRLIQGFDCPRSEVSGKRLWAWAQEDFGSADNFFRQFFVLNYCPLIWLEASGRNHTPEQLPANELAPVYQACDRHLAQVLKILAPKRAIGIGGFAMKRLQSVLGDGTKTAGVVNTSIPVGTILHPSPASPMANRGWAEQARQQLRAQGILAAL